MPVLKLITVGVCMLSAALGVSAVYKNRGLHSKMESVDIVPIDKKTGEKWKPYPVWVMCSLILSTAITVSVITVFVTSPLTLTILVTLSFTGLAVTGYYHSLITAMYNTLRSAVDRYAT